MKINKIASAAIAICACNCVGTGAMAQSSVTLFGVVDTGIAYIKTDNGHATSLINSANTASRLGFRGTEDLGGGLSASFWLEGALNNDVGGGASQTSGFDFARRATVSLSGPFGEIRLGRDNTPTYLVTGSAEPWLGRGLGSFELYGVSTAGATGIGSILRVGNSVGYFLPAKLGGLYGSVQYAFGERNSNTTPTTPVASAGGISNSVATAETNKTGNYMGARVGYQSGPLDIKAAYGVYTDAVRSVGTSFFADDYKIGNLAASYNFGVVKPMLLIQNEKIDGRGGVAAMEMNSYSVGATATVGAGVLRAAVTRYDRRNSGNDANKFAVGYVYSLSKRTSLYADLSRIANQGAAVYSHTAIGGATLPAATPGGNVSGVALGVTHAF